MAEEFVANHDWSFDVNLSGVQAPKGMGSVELPEGFYQVLVTDCYTNPEKNAGRVIFKLQVSEGPFTGAVRTDGQNIPRSADDKVRHYWRAIAESVGYTSAELDAGAIKLNAAAFKGRTAYIKFTPKSEASEYEDIKYYAPQTWERLKNQFEAGKAASRAVVSVDSAPGMDASAMAAQRASSVRTLGGGTSTSPEANGETVSKAAILAKLGMK